MRGEDVVKGCGSVSKVDGAHVGVVSYSLRVASIVRQGRRRSRARGLVHWEAVAHRHGLVAVPLCLELVDGRRWHFFLTPTGEAVSLWHDLEEPSADLALQPAHRRAIDIPAHSAHA